MMPKFNELPSSRVYRPLIRLTAIRWQFVQREVTPSSFSTTMYSTFQLWKALPTKV